MAERSIKAPASTYDAWHDRFGADQAADGPWHRLVQRHVGNVRGAAVLEIGCGRGGLAEWMDGRGATPYVAADFSWSAVALAASIGRSFVTAQADVIRLPHPDHCFDLVISCETVEHVIDPRAAIGELARVLRPGGRLLLTTPNYLNLMGLFRAYRRLVGRPFTEEGQPINNLTLIPRTVTWLRGAGLSTRLVDACGHYVPFPRHRPLRIRALDRVPIGARWVASHQLVVGVKRP